MSLIHGGDVEGYRLEYGKEPLDFSANINPLGLAPAVADALQRAISQVEHYPDPLCRKLTAAIAQKQNLPPNYILWGNGAADLIFRLVLAVKPRRALLPAPTFAEYAQALQMAGCAIEYHQLNFTLTESILPRLCKGIDIVFLCNPNNPTGLTAEPGLMQQILRRCDEQGITIAVDECFNGFLAEPQLHTVRNCFSKNLVVLDAFTKIYAMPGLRLGYAISANTNLLQKMWRAGQPWAVSVMAQAAGLAALSNKDYLQETRALLSRERQFLQDALIKAGFTVIGAEANYIFFYSKLPNLAQTLRQQGILIRDCANYQGLSKGYYRIAIKTPAENRRLLECLR